MIVQEALKRMRDQFAKRAEHYRTAIADPHGINTALSVAMLECKGVMEESLRELSEAELFHEANE